MPSTDLKVAAGGTGCDGIRSLAALVSDDLRYSARYRADRSAPGQPGDFVYRFGTAAEAGAVSGLLSFAARSKKLTFSRRGRFDGHDGRQKIPVSRRRNECAVQGGVAVVTACQRRASIGFGIDLWLASMTSARKSIALVAMRIT